MPRMSEGVELKTKGSVLIMNLFFSDAVLGIYSFAMLFVEGFYQLYVILRLNMNARLAECIATPASSKDEMFAIKRRIKKALGIFSLPVAAGVMLGFYMIVRIIDKPQYLQGMGYLGISMLSIAMIGVYIVFLNCISFSDKPQYESLIALVSLCFDCVCCYLCLRIGGKAGLLLFSFLSYAVYGLMIRLTLRKHVCAFQAH